MTKKISSHPSQAKYQLQIEQKDIQCLAMCKQLARQHAEQNIPASAKEVDDCQAPIKNLYETMAAQLNVETQSEKELILGAQAREKVREENAALELKKEILEGQVQAKEYEQNIAPNRLAERLKITAVLFVILGIWLGEISIFQTALQQLGQGNISNLFISISLSTSMVAVAHLTEKLMASIQNRKMKWIALVGILTAVGGVLFTLSYLRKRQFDTAHTDLPVIGYIGLSLLIFLALYMAITYWLKPLIEKYKANRVAMQSKSELKRMKKELQSTKDKISQNKNELYDDNTERLNNISTGKAMQELIARKYRHAMSVYVHTNKLHRQTPFPETTKDIPKLNTFYNHIKL